MKSRNYPIQNMRLSHRPLLPFSVSAPFSQASAQISTGWSGSVRTIPKV